jgi:tetratricopeptide (TPR) repeat protein
MTRPSESPDPTAVAASSSWRRRHPVLARAVLYGLGLAVGGVLLWLFALRRGQDAEDQHALRWKRLEQLPLVIQMNPEAPEAVKVLDAEYADPALPAALRARAERMRGIIARNRKDRAAVDASFEQALALDPAAAEATRIEWALCLADLKDGPAAMKLLLAARPTSLTLALWLELAVAQAEAAYERPPEGAGLGRVALLGRAPTPLPNEAPVWLGLTEWTPAGVALETTRWKVLGVDPASEFATGCWRRLAELAPQDFEALLAATEGLLAGQDPEGARATWRLAQSADPGAAGKALALRAALAPLRSR